MDVRQISRESAAGDPFRRQLGDLILSVGTCRFEELLFRTAREATGCEHLTAFGITSEGNATMIIAANTGHNHVARKTGEMYVSRFWHADPVNRLHDRNEVTTDGLLARANSQDIRMSAFRKECYGSSSWSQTGARMIERVSVFKRQAGQAIKVSFHRAKSAGPFGDSEVDNIANATDILAALIARHGSLAANTNHEDSREDCIRAVRTAAPDLSDREAEVCAGIVLGTTSEGIALDLKVSVNTVRTYRKRAYSRLQISSQNELMKIVLPHLRSAKATLTLSHSAEPGLVARRVLTACHTQG
jgi:DNA-binding CsgD family transcriptional regulator